MIAPAARAGARLRACWSSIAIIGLAPVRRSCCHLVQDADRRPRGAAQRSTSTSTRSSRTTATSSSTAGSLRYTINSIIVTSVSVAVGARPRDARPPTPSRGSAFRGRDRWATTILSLRFMPAGRGRHPDPADDAHHQPRRHLPGPGHPAVHRVQPAARRSGSSSASSTRSRASSTMPRWSTAARASACSGGSCCRSSDRA